MASVSREAGNRASVCSRGEGPLKEWKGEVVNDLPSYCNCTIAVGNRLMMRSWSVTTMVVPGFGRLLLSLLHEWSHKAPSLLCVSRYRTGWPTSARLLTLHHRAHSLGLTRTLTAFTVAVTSRHRQGAGLVCSVDMEIWNFIVAV